MSQDKRDIAIEKAKKIIEEHPDKNDYVCKYIVRSYDHNNNPTDNSIELDAFWEDCKRIIALPLTSKEQGTGAEGEAQRIWQLAGKYFEPKFSEDGKLMQKEKQRRLSLDIVDEKIKMLADLSQVPMSLIIEHYQQVRTCIEKM